MVRPSPLALLALACLPLGGCSAWPLLLRQAARPEQTVVSPPGEDGTRYLAVEGGPLSSTATLRSRWNAAARQVCDGEYTRLSDVSASRRHGGLTRGRIHEGYIRCLLPETSEPGAGPTVAEANATPSPTPRRARRANLARTQWSR